MLDLDLENGRRSNVNMSIERPHVTSYELEIAIRVPSVIACGILPVKMCLTSTFRTVVQNKIIIKIIKELFNDVLKDIVAHDLDLLFEGQRFESRHFGRLNVIISQTVTDEQTLLWPTHWKWLIDFQSIYLHSILVISKGEGREYF